VNCCCISKLTKIKGIFFGGRGWLICSCKWQSEVLFAINGVIEMFLLCQVLLPNPFPLLLLHDLLLSPWKSEYLNDNNVSCFPIKA